MAFLNRFSRERISVELSKIPFVQIKAKIMSLGEIVD